MKKTNKHSQRKKTYRKGGNPSDDYGKYGTGQIPLNPYTIDLSRFKTVDDEHNVKDKYVFVPRTNGYCVGKIIRPYSTSDPIKTAYVLFPDSRPKEISFKEDALNVPYDSYDENTTKPHPVFKYPLELK